MTGTQLFILDVTDIRAIRLECRRCRASVSIAPSAWDSVHRCPSCSADWPVARLSHENPVKAIATAIRVLKAVDEPVNSQSASHIPGVQIEVEAGLGTATPELGKRERK